MLADQSLFETGPRLVAEVIVPLPLDKLFHYVLPEEWAAEVRPGMRVLVQFGKRKEYAATVVRILSSDQVSGLKPALALLDDYPVVTEDQLLQWNWMSNYYMSPIGDIMNAALPPGLKLSSQSVLIYSPEVIPDESQMDDATFVLYEGLRTREKLTMDEVQQLTGAKRPIKLIETALEQGWAILEEELRKVAKAKRRKLIRVADEAAANLEGAFEQIARAKSQTEAFLALVGQSAPMGKWLDKRAFLAEFSVKSAALQALIKRGLVEEGAELDGTAAAEQPDSEIVLNALQRGAFDSIVDQETEGKPILLHGVTASGKTEIYIQLIKRAFEQHKRVLFLVPEIALTAQLIERLRVHFNLAVNHSRFNPSERLAAWRESLVNDEPLLVLGARSAIFMPLPDLGLIIVDEEHEPSYKQYEPSPRYQARDTAVWMASHYGCPIVLGSATPSLESIFNAQQGRYIKVELLKRYHAAPLPEIEVVDMVGAMQRKEVKGHFSIELVDAIRLALNQGESVILFQNRRGFATYQQCQTCGHVEECTRCDISLTYHKGTDQLKCHYCGYQTPPLMKCSSCGAESVVHKGFGTEQIQEEVMELFPKARVKRMDLDTTRGKYAYSDLINAVAAGEVDILVGTQMVTKGLDFNKVGLVGVMNADNLLSIPNFRANERAFQMMEQVAGRTGRRAQRGRVLIQSMKPKHSIIQLAMDHNFDGMVKRELPLRQQYGYPPFVRLITITLKHRDRMHLEAASREFATALKSKIGDRFLGPEYAPIARLKNLYQMQVMVKVDKGALGSTLREAIKKAYQQSLLTPKFNNIKVYFDVDPG